MCLGLMMIQGDGADNLGISLQYVQNVYKLPRHAGYVKTRNLNPTRILSDPCISKIRQQSAMKIKRIHCWSLSDNTEPVGYDECNHTIASKGQ